MSTGNERITQAHFEYIAAHTRDEEEQLRELQAAAREAGIPAIAIGPEQAGFMQILLRAMGAKVVVEVGTLAGYSAIAMSRALPEGGRVDTIEVKPEYAAFAQEWVRRTGAETKVVVHAGAGMDVLPGFAEDSADAAFLDADKRSYPDYLRECRRIVRPGGLILVDNAFAFGQLFDDAPTDPEAEHIKRFNEEMAAQTGLHGIIVPFGDGLWVAVQA